MKTVYKLLVILVLSFGPMFAQSIGAPTAYVNDYANVLSKSTIDINNDKITQLAKDNETQIFVAVIESLKGADIDEYTSNLFKQWKPGRVKNDRGLLLVVAVTDHKYRIEVGYGLEGQINDAKAGDIGRDMVPYLKNNDYNGAVTKAVDELITEARPNDKPAALVDTSSNDPSIWVIIIPIFLLVAGFSYLIFYKRKKEHDLEILAISAVKYANTPTPHYDVPRHYDTSKRVSSRYSPPVIVPVVIPSRRSSYDSDSSSSSSSSSYDYGSSSSSDSSSSSSSDFSGGWGGSSDGGGASGSW